MEEHAVLVVTRLGDTTADFVLSELSTRGVPVVRLDPGTDFPVMLSLAARFDGSGLSGRVRTATRELDLRRVRSVYWRKPTPYAPVIGVRSAEERWTTEQARFGLGGVLEGLSCAAYVNHPWRNREAEYKPRQLAIASGCGFTVPPTVVTNCLQTARSFAEEVGSVVYKPVASPPYWNHDCTPLTVWTDDVDPHDLDQGIGSTAHLFQQRIDKVADLRITVVGKRVFAVRIESDLLDWRTDYTQHRYTQTPSPPDLTDALHAYMRRFNLVFAAFDFALDRQNRAWFLEANANGQWAFLDPATVEKITNALADELQSPEESL